MDLFDLWIALKNDMTDCQKVVEVFLSHCDKLEDKISRDDVVSLLIDSKSWLTDLTYRIEYISEMVGLNACEIATIITEN